MNDPRHPVGHLLQAYHDSELDESMAAEVKAHCEECATCRDELAELERVEHLLAGTPAPELSRTVWHRVRPGRPREARLQPAFGFAACAVGIVLGFWLGPIDLQTESEDTETAWTETVTVWDSGASSSLLDVFRYEQE